MTVSRDEYDRIARAYRALAAELDCMETVHRQAREFLESVAGTAYASGKNPDTTMTNRTHYRGFLTNE